MTNKNLGIFLFIIGGLLLVGVGILVGARIVLHVNNYLSNDLSDYTAVYMTTGDIYFGKMDWLPAPHLKNVWYIQKGATPSGQSQLGVVPFKSSFWGPVDEIYINFENVIFWTRLRKDSQLAQAFESQAMATTTPSTK